MNILHTETLTNWGGQQNRVLAEAAGLNKRGHNVIIVCHRGSILAGKSGKAGVKVYEVNMVKQAHLKNVPRLVSIIRKEKIDIVSTHSSVDSWAGGIAAKLAGRTLVRFRHNLYAIGKDPLTGLIYALPDAFIAISNTVRDIVVNRVGKNKKVAVIPSSVDSGTFHPGVPDLREELNIPADAIVIGNTSTFTWTKGQEFLMKAFNIIYREFPCILLFAGRLIDSKKGKYLMHVDRELRDKVMLIGHREDIPRVLNTIDIYTYPSILEGLGTALLEAMTMGRPVAVSDIPTFRDFIIDKVNGLFFKTKDPEDLAEKVLFLMRNRDIRDRLGKKARDAALDRFSIERMLDSTETYYMDLLNAR